MLPSRCARVFVRGIVHVRAAWVRRSFAGQFSAGTHWLQTAIVNASTFAPLAIAPAIAVGIGQEAELLLESPAAAAEYDERVDTHVLIAGHWRAPQLDVGAHARAAFTCTIRWNGLLLRTYTLGEQRVEHRLDVADLEGGAHEVVVSVERDPSVPICTITRRIWLRRNTTLAALEY